MVGVLSNKITREQLQPGDHIYSWRSYAYAHHGIYMGDENVIHFTRAFGQESSTGTAPNRFVSSSLPHSQNNNDCQHCIDVQLKYRTKPDERAPTGSVIISCLACFLSGGNLYLFVYSASKAFFLAKAHGGTCTMAPSDSPDFVLYRALYLLKHGFGAYSLFRNNCEDFAIYCKTGLVVKNGKAGLSGQINSGIAFFVALCPVPLLAGIPSFTTTLYNRWRYSNDIGVRNDVLEVPVEELVQNARAI